MLSAHGRITGWVLGCLPPALAVATFIVNPNHLGTLMRDPLGQKMMVAAIVLQILGGMQVVTSRMLDARKTFAIGIALVFGLSVEMVPGLYRGVPRAVQPLFASSLSLSTVLVVLLNLVTRIGVARERSIELSPAHDGHNEVTRFMEEQGAIWGMRKEAATRAAQVSFTPKSAALSSTRKPRSRLPPPSAA